MLDRFETQKRRSRRGSPSLSQKAYELVRVCGRKGTRTTQPSPTTKRRGRPCRWCCSRRRRLRCRRRGCWAWAVAWSAAAAARRGVWWRGCASLCPKGGLAADAFAALDSALGRPFLSPAPPPPPGPWEKQRPAASAAVMTRNVHLRGKPTPSSPARMIHGDS